MSSLAGLLLLELPGYTTFEDVWSFVPLASLLSCQEGSSGDQWPQGYLAAATSLESSHLYHVMSLEYLRMMIYPPTDNVDELAMEEGEVGEVVVVVDAVTGETEEWDGVCIFFFSSTSSVPPLVAFLFFVFYPFSNAG